MDELTAIGSWPISGNLGIPVHPGQGVPFADFVVLNIKVNRHVAFETILQQCLQVCFWINWSTILEGDLQPRILFLRRKHVGVILTEFVDTSFVIGGRITTLSLQVIVLEGTTHAV